MEVQIPFYSDEIYLAIAGYADAIKKMLTVEGHDLYDLDEWVDRDYREDEELRKYLNPLPSQTCDIEFAAQQDDEKTSKSHRKRSSAILDPHTDLFASRHGKTLFWRNVNMTLLGKEDKQNRKILSDVWGEVPGTETTAIMGASGAGKTSLLNILSGRTSTVGRIKIEADVRFNNYLVDPMNIEVRRSIAFVEQHDSLHEATTPREAIRFSAKLRLPQSATEEQLDLLTLKMLTELGLEACADTVVGGPLLKGISGGERKRTSIGVELVVKPTMVFLDEPTSGLDSFSAMQVCQVLKKVANAGSSVLFTIHQPSSKIFASFDRLILMHKGLVMFQGPVRSIPKYFSSRGYPVPANYNPADWVIHVAQHYTESELRKNGFFAKDARVITEPSISLDQDTVGIPFHKNKSTKLLEDRLGFLVQTNLLLVREFSFLFRNPVAMKARFGTLIILNVIIGAAYFGVGESDLSNALNLQSQLGSIMNLMIFAIVGCAMPIIVQFPEERPIFIREYSTSHYKIIPYSLSLLLREGLITFIQMLNANTILYNMIKFRGSFMIIFWCSFTLAMTSSAMAFTLGVLSKGNPKVAVQLVPAILLPQFLFCGFFVSPSLIPPFLRWIQYICPLTYGLKIVAVEFFDSCSENVIAARNCEMMLENLQSDPNETWVSWLVMLTQFGVFCVLSLFLLRKSVEKYN